MAASARQSERLCKILQSLEKLPLGYKACYWTLGSSSSLLSFARSTLWNGLTRSSPTNPPINQAIKNSKGLNPLLNLKIGIDALEDNMRQMVRPIAPPRLYFRKNFIEGLKSFI